MQLFFSRLLHLWQFRLLLIGAIMLITGDSLNYLAKQANDGLMPVATTRDELFFVIGSEEHLGDYVSSDIMDDTHRKMAGTDRLSYLSDRILIIPNDTSALLENMCTTIRLEKLTCPLSASLRIASIGDLMIWVGVIFLLLSLVVLFMKIMYRFAYFCVDKTTRM
jgi:hypothetical protein